MPEQTPKHRIHQGNKVNAETLHAVDTLYLQGFQQNLLAEIRRARFSLKQYHQQGESLAKAEELPLACQQYYGEISARLLPLINMLGSMLSGLESGDLSWQAATPTLEEDLIEATTSEDDKGIIGRLDSVEQEILVVLDKVGDSLAALPRSIIAWDDCGQFRVHALLKRLPQRSCYDLDIPIDFHIQPFLIADYFANRKRGKRQCVLWPHYLIDEVIPLNLYPLIEDLWVDMEIRGDGYASWRTRVEATFGKLNTPVLPSASRGEADR
ncbi:MAG: hypothetical protein B7Z35_01200 [Hydrogenophilales bacterium 12-61-10]|nr:MAG: hypothetical protein B7Z35_01200 [Hydrogenophilales bacterium 12-61-10]